MHFHALDGAAILRVKRIAQQGSRLAQFARVNICNSRRSRRSCALCSASLMLVYSSPCSARRHAQCGLVAQRRCTRPVRRGILSEAPPGDAIQGPSPFARNRRHCKAQTVIPKRRRRTTLAWPRRAIAARRDGATFSSGAATRLAAQCRQRALRSRAPSALPPTSVSRSSFSSWVVDPCPRPWSSTRRTSRCAAPRRHVGAFDATTHIFGAKSRESPTRRMPVSILASRT